MADVNKNKENNANHIAVTAWQFLKNFNRFSALLWSDWSDSFFHDVCDDVTRMSSAAVFRVCFAISFNLFIIFCNGSTVNRNIDIVTIIHQKYKMAPKTILFHHTHITSHTIRSSYTVAFSLCVRVLCVCTVPTWHDTEKATLWKYTEREVVIADGWNLMCTCVCIHRTSKQQHYRISYW